MNAYLHSFSRYIPSRRVSNHDLAQSLDTSDEWIFSHTGIRYRHIAEEDETASTMAIQTAKQSIARSSISKDDIDVLIFTSSTPDYPGSVPPTAGVVQHALGLPNAAAMDLGAACSGFVYAIEIAKNFIRAGNVHNVLVVSSEVYSKIVDWEDRNTCVLFGDGAASCLVSATDLPSIGEGIFRSDGSGGQFLYCTPGERPILKMNGRRVYNFVVNAIPVLMYALLELNEVKLSDLAWVIPHQANQRMIESICKRENIDDRIFFNNIAEYGNTASASIPIALSELEEQKRIKDGDLLLVLGFGAGFTHGGMLVRWRAHR